MNRSVIIFIAMLSASLSLFAAVANAAVDSSETLPPPAYCQWEIKNFSIDDPLCGLTGDAKRGKEIATDGSRGNCVACHVLPVDGIEAFGTIGPSLIGVGKRLPVGFLRLRIVDTRRINPMSIMPGFYRDPALIHRPAKNMIGRTFLTAQQIEDVIAYMETLK